MADYVVVHPKLYLRVNGKMQSMEKDSEISLPEKAAKSLVEAGKIIAKGKAKTTVIDGEK